MGSSRLFLDQNHFFNFLIHFAPRGATRNLTFLNTQNWPTLLVSCPNIQCLPCIPLPYIRWLPWSAAQTLGVYLYSAAPTFGVYLSQLPQHSVFTLLSCHIILWLPWSAASTFGVYLGQLPLSKHFAGHQSNDCHANVQVVLLNWQCHKILWRNLAMSVCI